MTYDFSCSAKYPRQGSSSSARPTSICASSDAAGVPAGLPKNPQQLATNTSALSSSNSIGMCNGGQQQAVNDVEQDQTVPVARVDANPSSTTTLSMGQKQPQPTLQHNHSSNNQINNSNSVQSTTTTTNTTSTASAASGPSSSSTSTAATTPSEGSTSRSASAPHIRYAFIHSTTSHYLTPTFQLLQLFNG